MIAVDTNVLVYAHRRDSAFHPQAKQLVQELAESSTRWAIPWSCLHEFYSIVTHRQIYQPASTIIEALTQIGHWTASQSVSILSETGPHLATLSALLTASNVVGPKVHDARIAAICISHGVSELVTMDRDFSRFPQLRTRSLLA